MELAIANTGLGHYRRIMQILWDPEPTNDVAADQPVWCLGCSYRLSDGMPRAAASVDKNAEQNVDQAAPQTPPPRQTTASTSGLAAKIPKTPPESSSGGPSHSHACADHPRDDGGWPHGFLSDIDARFWMTYRSDFEPIPKSSDPSATSTLSLPMRMKSLLGEQGGFSSDSGWGCMIRSGQSLLMNAMAMLLMGRGKIPLRIE